jgi:hypothetical protein
MKTHQLKCWPKFFESLVNGSRGFELRKNDRDFRVGDFLVLSEWDPSTRSYTGKQVRRVILYVLRAEESLFPGLEPGHAILSLGDETVPRVVPIGGSRDETLHNW